MAFEKENKTFLRISYFAILLFLYLIQYTPFMFKIGGVYPNLILSFAIIVSFNENDYFAAFFGLTSGILADANSQIGFGTHALFYFIIALFCSLTVEILMQNNTLSFAILFVPILFLNCIFEWLFSAGFSLLGAKPELFMFYIKSGIYSLAVSIPMYALFRLVYRNRKKERSAYAFANKKKNGKNKKTNTVKDY